MPGVQHLWTHWGLNPGPSACRADVVPLGPRCGSRGTRLVSSSDGANPGSCLRRMAPMLMVCGSEARQFRRASNQAGEREPPVGFEPTTSLLLSGALPTKIKRRHTMLDVGLRSAQAPVRGNRVLSRWRRGSVTVHQPGIEPGSHRWRRCILPPDH